MSGYVDTSFVIGVAFKTMSNSPVCDKVILLVGLEFSRNPFAFILEFLGAARIASNNSRQLHFVLSNKLSAAFSRANKILSIELPSQKEDKDMLQHLAIKFAVTKDRLLLQLCLQVANQGLID